MENKERERIINIIQSFKIKPVVETDGPIITNYLLEPINTYLDKIIEEINK